MTTSTSIARSASGRRANTVSSSTNTSAFCPALFLCAPASGQGKTTITAALARLLTRRGKVVRVFKTGPDYLDPKILQQASGRPVDQLDMWMAGENYCQQKFHEAAQIADLILVEGAMGMFDGEPSSADLAARFNIPLAIVMDVKGMAQTAAAVAMGLAGFRDDINVVGMIANNCGTERHRQLIDEALTGEVKLLANLPRSEAVALPERHLGLVQACEVADELEARFEAGADWLDASGILDAVQRLEPVEFFSTVTDEIQPLLCGMRIAVARDSAFSFIYQANEELLQKMGVTLAYFSPLTDTEIPEADALWLPGGYPELHARELSSNQPMLEAVRQFRDQDKPVLAECGGFLYCLETLTDLDGNEYPMSGILQGHGAMRGKRGCQGMQAAPLPEGEVRAHAHHRSRSSDTPEPIAFGRRQRHVAPGEAIYRSHSVTGTYLHLFFPSNPAAVARLFSPGECGADAD